MYKLLAERLVLNVRNQRVGNTPSVLVGLRMKAMNSLVFRDWLKRFVIKNEVVLLGLVGGVHQLPKDNKGAKHRIFFSQLL